MRNARRRKSEKACVIPRRRLLESLRQLSHLAAVGGDNALSDRVTPRNFRKTRKLHGAAETRRSRLVTEG
jgi:hypothetical protein